MVKIVLINKNGIITSKNASKLDENNLHKKAGFKTSDNFKLCCTWKTKIGNKYIQLYAKDTGKANNENKYELPPPVDKKIYYGSLAFVKSNIMDKFLVEEDLEVSELITNIEGLFGGFEEIGSETTSISENETQYEDNIELTKEGYVKDDFVVDEDSDEDNTEEEFVYEGELQYEEYTDEES
jgi:hypothetical protein